MAITINMHNEVIDMENRIGFGKRFIAVIIDAIIVSVLAFFIAPLIGGTLGGLTGAGATTAGAEMALADGGGAAGGILGMIMGSIIASAVVVLVYFLLEAFTGATLGKMILGIKIGTDDGKNGSTPLYLKRYLIKNIGSFVVIAGGLLAIEMISNVGNIISFVIFLGYFIVFSSKKQALHDLLSKTAVYKRADLA